MHAVAAGLGADVAVPHARAPHASTAVAAAAPTRSRGELDVALAAACAGDEDGFVALYRDLQPRLLRYATALVGNDAEDVTAETWLQIARDLPRFSGDVDGFRGWASSICRNRAMDVARSRSRRPATPTDIDVLAEQPAPGDAAGSALEAMSTREAIALISELPQDQAEAVLLRAVVGLDAPSVATVLGKRPGAVRVAAHRGLRRLARMLDDGEVGRA
ncbi:RNA polymerase sigma factor [Pseudonocardia sp. N23]|uniref:RNA polymerase sigma factor n=1 Tax=Pseudonocardia sp. N23 TaxID=1987376 RepID=UPI001C0ED77F|nr:RNA polymerase sigma factor [Pseudonocardia sp. N23]